MLALDFPLSPAVGQSYRQGPDQPTYVWNGTLWLRSPAILSPPTAGYRNALINGNFNIIQRSGWGASGGFRFGPDRWFFNANGGAGTSIAAGYNSMALGSSGLPTEVIQYPYVQVTSVANAGSFAQFVHRVEGVRTFAGKRATLSWIGLAQPTALPMSVQLLQYFGTGGSPSANVNVPTQKITIGTSTWVRYILNFDIPSISGKTVGTNRDDFLQLIFWLSAGSTYNADSGNLGEQSGYFYWIDVQFEEGPVATPFERRPWHVELEMCQRYYDLGAVTYGAPVPSTGGYACYFMTPFKVTKRVAPTMGKSWSGQNNVAQINNVGASQWGDGSQLVGSALGNMGATLNWNASAEL